MATNISSSRLDFNNIKNRLKTFLAAKSEFTDYDFEASGLNNILDVLAYNTHFNGLTANFALNESFLNTAQLRSSIVSHAETLGYTPRSITASIAYLNLSLDLTGVANRPSTITIPRYTAFTSSVAGVSYTFRTIASYTAPDDGTGSYTFVTAEGSTSIPVYQGTERTKTFFVGDITDRQLYVIPDNTIDTTTLDVKVYASPTSSSYTTYTLLDNATSVGVDSTYYSIHEAPNGFYEIHFSDGITFGTAPISGNKIVINYLSTVGADANGGSTFAPVSQVTVNAVNYNLGVVTVANSSSGASKEDSEAIRLNAPIAFAAQQRLVTADDYKALILKRYSVATDVSSWGGQDNVPVDYGKVYISIKYVDGTAAATKTATESSITTNLVNKLGVMSITPVYVEPINTYIETKTTFRYDPSATNITRNTLSSNIQTVINTYFTNNLKKFNTTFRKSNLLTLIDDVDPGVLNSKMSIVMNQRVTPTLGVSQSHTVIFPVALPSPDDVNYIITSSYFTVNSQLCNIRNLLGSTKLQLVNQSSQVVIDNLGSYNTNGTVNIEGLTINSMVGSTFKLKAVPANESTITPLRNYIIDNDIDDSYVTGVTET